MSSRIVPLLMSSLRARGVINFAQRERARRSRITKDNEEFPRRDRAPGNNFSGNCMDRRRCAWHYTAAIGPRTTLLPPDVYEPLSRRSRYGGAMLKLRADPRCRRCTVYTHDAALSGEGRGLLFANILICAHVYERILSSPASDHQRAIKNDTREIASTGARPIPFGTSAKFSRCLLLVSAVFERRDSLARELITGATILPGN